MSVFNKLPAELSLSIVETLNLRDAECMYSALPKGLHSSRLGIMLQDRMDPCVYLRKLTHRPKEFLGILDKYTSIIGGRCVLPYFFPNVNFPEERWRIYCPEDNTKELIKDLNSIGMVWRDATRPIVRRARYGNADDICAQQLPSGVNVCVGFSMNSCDEYTTVEIVEMYDVTPLHGIISSFTTATQCYIASSFACHMHYSEIDTGHATVWFERLLSGVSVCCIKKAKQYTSCKSCGVVLANRSVPMYSLVRNLVMLRCKKCISSVSDSVVYERVLSMINDTHSTTQYHDVSVSALTAAYLADCTCDYNTSVKYVKACVDSGLLIGMYDDTRSAGPRYMDDEGAYTYAFGTIEGSTLKYIRRVYWNENTQGVSIEQCLYEYQFTLN